MPASKTSPPSTKRIPSSPANKKSPNTAPSQSQAQPQTQTQTQPQANAKPANPPAAAPAPPVADSSLDNQPIPKLITTNETVHYSYASAYGVYAQQHYHGVTTAQMPAASMHSQIVQNTNMYVAPNQYAHAQPAMPPTLQPANLQFQQSNPAAAYYQPPPPPNGPRNHYYHGPT